MSFMEVSIMHHLAIALVVLWICVSFGYNHPVIFFVALWYLYKVNERYSMRLRKRIQYEERKSANQRRLLSDTESVRWLNHAVGKIWPICMEQIASQNFLMPIIPWFLEKFKPWTARKATIQHLYLGRNPPTFTDIRVITESADDDHLVLELGMNFLSAEDMSGILAVKLRKRLGFGITANMHVTGMHIEGKVLVGVKFLQHWPFIGRVRICFVEPPYFQMTVKPVFGHGVDVTELPGISGWLDKLLDVAFGQTLVEPNMLVVDVEKFASTPREGWFTVDERPPIAHAKVEILEGADMKPSDPNGLADPYVKCQLGPYRFQTKIQRKTLSPKWLEEFKVPISSWEAPNVLVLQVRDKDPIFDDMLGDYSINLNDLRGGQRHDKWFSLKNIKMGRLHLALTILEDELEKGKNDPIDDEVRKTSETMTPGSTSTAENHNCNTDECLENYQKMADEYEPINIEGQEKTGLWVHHPGSDLSQTWEPRKGRARQPETQVHREDCKDSASSSTSGSQLSDTSSEENVEGNKPGRLGKIKKGLHKLGSVFHKSPRKDIPIENDEEPTPTPRPNLPPTPRPNIPAVGEKRTSLTVILDEDCASNNGENKAENSFSSPDIDKAESPGKNHVKSKVKSMVQQASKPAQSLKSVLSRKCSNKTKEDQSLDISERDESQGSRLSTDALKDDPLVVVEGSPISLDHVK
ncbi:C2 domain-containing protein At1g53590-like isoform X1 [Typha latifolia]|uniref:C2 domain-containing protein At1g53590-like isoform X1 n=3 Tax=Typha latifolia TaxID=4733 RepID=UPI003C2CAFDF